MIEQAVTERRCKCGRASLITDFYAQKNGKGGHKSECKLCTREGVAARDKANRVATSGHKGWRPAEELELLDHVARGLTLASFAEKARRSIYAVRNKAAVLMRVPHIDADKIGRSPFQPSAGAHLDWQSVRVPVFGDGPFGVARIAA